MATNEQKEELMQTLKFTPRNYKIEITGYGGEIYYGVVDRKIYDFFKEKRIDIEQYASDWDDEKWEDIPSDMRPFDPGAPFDIGGTHESGATFDDGSYVTVYDENGEEIWSSPLGEASLRESGAMADQYCEESLDDYETGTVVFYGAQGEKGTFFGNEFRVTAPFDPSKLLISYGSYDGWDLVSSVSYDGEDIDGYDYDTTGKWGEAKWIIVGDTEEVYEGEEREDTSDDEEDDDE